MKNIVVWTAGMVVIAMLAGCGSGGGGASSIAGNPQSQAATVSSGQSGNCTVSLSLSSELPVSPANVRGVSFHFVVPEGIEPISDNSGYTYGGRVQVAPASIALVVGAVQGVVAASYDPATRVLEFALVDDSGFNAFGSTFANIAFQLSAPAAGTQAIVPSIPAVEEVLDESGTPYAAGTFTVAETVTVN
ncbi:hypothetical protein GMSM_27770 [Geomonas sp. Red276]